MLPTSAPAATAITSPGSLSGGQRVAQGPANQPWLHSTGSTAKAPPKRERQTLPTMAEPRGLATYVSVRSGLPQLVQKLSVANGWCAQRGHDSVPVAALAGGA